MTVRNVDNRQRVHDKLADRIRACKRCGEDMNIPDVTQAAPGYGSLRSPVVVVGQSLCGPCMATQIPFTGGTGLMLDDALKRARRRKEDIYTTNVVHCHPRDNDPSLPEWVAKCTPYLREELAIVRSLLVIGLGEDAEKVLRANYPKAHQLDWPLTTVRGIAPAATGRPVLLFPPHPGSFRWKKKEIREDLREQWVDCLARAIRWGFRQAETIAAEENS